MVNREKAKNLRVLHHNIQSLKNKIQEIAIYLYVNETMLYVLFHRTLDIRGLDKTLNDID
jgi:hypothetical protein